MSAEYYGVGLETRVAVERLLNLQPRCPEGEQEWEYRLGDPARIDEIVDLLERRDLDLEMRSAVAQLLMSGIYDAESDGVLSFEPLAKLSEAAEFMVLRQSEWVAHGRSGRLAGV